MKERLLEKLLTTQAKIADQKAREAGKRERQKINERRNRIYDLTHKIEGEFDDID